MSRATVYQGLKAAILYKRLPFHHFEDDFATIAFESWKQFGPVDAMLDSLPMPSNMKLNIYSELVGDCTDGVAVTVSDDVQHLGYMQSERGMPYKVATFEDFLSRLFRLGCNPLGYDYESFNVSLSLIDFSIIEEQLTRGHLLEKKPLISNAKGNKTIYLSFDW